MLNISTDHIDAQIKLALELDPVLYSLLVELYSLEPLTSEVDARRFMLVVAQYKARVALISNIINSVLSFAEEKRTPEDQ